MAKWRNPQLRWADVRSEKCGSFLFPSFANPCDGAGADGISWDAGVSSRYPRSPWGSVRLVNCVLAQPLLALSARGITNAAGFRPEGGITKGPLNRAHLEAWGTPRYRHGNAAAALQSAHFLSARRSAAERVGGDCNREPPSPELCP